jgi:intracellular sulfur oxidation DsrE/DsrF family protein
MNRSISDETLHAFVDGELDVAESERLVAQLREDEALAQRVCNLRRLKDMVRLAYAEPPDTSAAGNGRGASGLRRVAQRWAYACSILAVGLGLGWSLRGLDAVSPPGSPAGPEAVTLAVKADPGKVLLHLDNASPARMLEVLDRAEKYLNEAEAGGRAMQLEVIANSRGLDLLRVGYSPYSERIARMRQRHANLQFVACSQSVARFIADGEEVVLLPAARTAPTAIGEIVTRLQQGWTYVRV